MTETEEGARINPHNGSRIFATCCLVVSATLVVLFGGLHVVASPDTDVDDSHRAKRIASQSQTAKGISRQIDLDGPGDTGPMPCKVVQILDSDGNPKAYFMDVGSVVCKDAKCETVTVRIHFDPLGSYERYELPSGGNLTKLGHKPFSRADHDKLHQILSDPYSQLKSIGLNEITVPKSSAATGNPVDAISAPTMLSKQSTVVVGAAYTCCTLWHWSHGKVCDVIRDMTVQASDKQDFVRYLESDKDEYGTFALEQLRTQNLFDPQIIAAVVQVLRHGSEKLTDAALEYLAKASTETGVDSFFCCSEDECLQTNSRKRVQFLEALRDTTRDFPAGYLGQFGGWLARANSYYEVHLLLTLLERQSPPSEETIRGAMALLESDDSLVVRRSYRYLKAQELAPSQQKQLEAFEQQHSDRL